MADKKKKTSSKPATAPDAESAAKSPEPNDNQTTKLAAIAGIAVVAAVGLYIVRSVWLAEAPPPPATNYAAPQSSDPNGPSLRDQAVGNAEWGVPNGAPILGVGSTATADTPSNATLEIKDGRTVFGLRLPKTHDSGETFDGYTIDLRSGESRLWGTTLRGSVKEGDNIATISLNTTALAPLNADLSSLKINVSAAYQTPQKRRKQIEKIGQVRLTLKQP